MTSATFFDKNVIIDAAEHIAHVWGLAGAVLPLDPATLPNLDALTTRDFVQALSLLGLSQLAAKVTSGEVPAEMVRAQLTGQEFSDVLSQDPTPGWLIGMLGRSPDPRLRDLAPANRETTVVVTTEVMADSQRILASKGFDLSVATGLVHALVRDVEVVALPFNQRQAIESGALDEMHARVTSKAPTHVADVDWGDPYWRVRPDVHPSPKPAGKSWSQHKKDEYGVYGVDGEDLFLLWQVEYCSQVLGIPVQLATSDYHCAYAALQADVCHPIRYSFQGSGYGREVLGEQPRSVKIASRAPKSFAPTTTPTVIPTPAAMRKPSGIGR